MEHYDLAQLSKVLATINVDADFAYNMEEAVLGNLYTEEAYVLFQRLQFKNLLSRFEVSGPTNKVEDYFTVIKDKKAADAIFAKAKTKNTAGVSFYKDTTNVLPSIRFKSDLLSGYQPL